MAKTKKPPKSHEAYPKLPTKSAPAQPPASHAMRETVESIVIAFVLAFLFRTFEAEAFVIPTGSMAPTLMGRHKDVVCSQCGKEFRISASEEEGDEKQSVLNRIGQLEGQLRLDYRNRSDGRTNLEIQREIDDLKSRLPLFDIVAGVCPQCRYPMPVRPDLPPGVAPDINRKDIAWESSYNGDRILVNKYVYTVDDPQRFDIVVFKFPGNAQMNYIKRLVGLPGETIRIYEGDLFTTKSQNPGDKDFAIARKPPAHQLAMRQFVHDTDLDPVSLYKAGWPLRWESTDAPGAPKWTTAADAEGTVVRQRYSIDSTSDQTAWLRYRNFVPTSQVWAEIERAQFVDGSVKQQLPSVVSAAQPQLITDYTAYNSRITRGQAESQGGLRLSPERQGLHWVGDLMVEADVNVEEARGQLILDLVEAGKHFTATIDLATGKVVLGAEGLPDFAPTAETSIKTAGSYHFAFSNFDDQLRLWVDGSLVEFDASTEYDAEQIWGSRQNIIPQTSDSDPGDLAPVGIGARDTKIEVTRLQVWRDLYYVADSWDRQRMNDVVTDFNHPFDRSLLRLPVDPSNWPRYGERNHVEFPLTEDQFFVMGDNSPESSDARLWLSGGNGRGRPGGAYLERQLLIGKALCVYWPHSWNRIPGTPIPFPLFPNFEDMRLVR